MPLKTRAVEAGLSSKGFVKRNKHHKTMRYVTSDGIRTSVITHYSHGASGRQVLDRDVSAMARQCKISTKQFKQLVSCELTREAYECLLRERGIVDT